MLSFTLIVSICIGIVILLSFGIHTVICLVKAKKSGVVRTVFTADRTKMIIELGTAAFVLAFSVINGVMAYSYRAYIRDMDARGLAAIAEHDGVSVDELNNVIENAAYSEMLIERYKDFFINDEQRRYSQSAVHHTDMMIVYLVISIVFAASTLTHRAFFTEDGIYVLDKPDTSPLKAYARVSGKYLCFYEKPVPNMHLISVKATDENLEAYKSFIVPEDYRVCY